MISILAQSRDMIQNREVQTLGTIQLILDGDTQEFKSIVSTYGTAIYRFVFRIVREATTAEDLTQEIFLKAFKSLYQYDSHYRFSTWLYRIALNTCTDFFRKKEPIFIELEKVLQVSASEKGTPEQILENKSTHLLIQAALNKIPEKYREIFILKDIEELSYEEIAEIVNLPITTLKIRVIRAREMLKDLLKNKV